MVQIINCFTVIYFQESLRHLITKRIGLETFMDKLNDVSRNESYTRANKHPQPIAQNSQSLLLDYEFCKLFKMLEGGNHFCMINIIIIF